MGITQLRTFKLTKDGDDQVTIGMIKYTRSPLRSAGDTNTAPPHPVFVTGIPLVEDPPPFELQRVDPPLLPKLASVARQLTREWMRFFLGVCCVPLILRCTDIANMVFNKCNLETNNYEKSCWRQLCWLFGLALTLLCFFALSFCKTPLSKITSGRKCHVQFASGKQRAWRLGPRRLLATKNERMFLPIVEART